MGRNSSAVCMTLSGLMWQAEPSVGETTDIWWLVFGGDGKLHLQECSFKVKTERCR